jgi:hypothetical protein
VRTYIKNGKKNGGPPADITDGVTYSDLYNLDVTTPGYVRLPVCTADMAFQAWAAAGIRGNEGIALEPNWPCVPS